MMSKADFLHALEEVMEMDSGSLTGTETLADLAQWDSLAILSFMAKVDEVFGVQLSAEPIAKSKTVADLAALLPDHVSA